MSMFDRIVSHQEAREAVQRLINSHFDNGEHAHVSIPVQAMDDDVVASDYIAQQEEREASAVQARDRQWCSELAKHDVAARAVYPGGIEIEVPTIAEALEMEKCPSCGHDLAALGKD